MNDPSGRTPLAIGMSATLGDPGKAFSRLVGRDPVIVVQPQPSEVSVNPRGREYFLFIQPEVESRERDVAGAATAIQSMMCLGHGMRRRTGTAGGYRGLVFLDSIDKVRRLHSAYDDAEVQKGLASLRTVQYPDDPVSGAPRSACCGEPAHCGVFRDGECWVFAPSDRRQVYADGKPWRPGKSLSVAPRPVYSGNAEAVEKMIKESDLVFATSSLEVGYDDPDISFVFQHYGPQNLASFIQRKGRGGRGTDDRPLTAVTLSIYAPRDTYWFARPDIMLDASKFEAPLNPDNHFVRRAQILSLALDAYAYVSSRSGIEAWLSDGSLRPEALRTAEKWIENLFGPSAWRAFGHANLSGLWDEACAMAPGDVIRDARAARNRLPWIPTFLHDTINLPELQIRLAHDQTPKRDDIALVMALAAPGNVSRRFDPRRGCWRPPIDGHGPWLSPEDYATAERIPLFGGDSALVLRELPLDARRTCGSRLAAVIVRPRQVTFETAGEFARQGAGWFPRQKVLEDGTVSDLIGNADQPRAVGHESVGNLLGSAIVIADPECAKVLAGSIGSVFERIEAFIGTGSVGMTGLRLIRANWGAEGEIAFHDRQEDPVSFAQTFIDPASGTVALHGYAVDTEAVRFLVDGRRLTRFIAGELAAGDARNLRELRLSRTRALCTAALQSAGVHRFSAELIGRLTGYLVTTPAYDADVSNLVRRWGVNKLENLLNTMTADRHAADPTVTRRRLDRAIDALKEPAASAAMAAALQRVDDETEVASHMRSTVLHGMALRLRELTVTVAQGDERRILAHAKLPLQFGGDASDTITIAEIGQYGDGTIRAFDERVEEFARLWTQGYAGTCPNALEDQAIERAVAQSALHAEWLKLNPRDENALHVVAAVILGDGAPGKLPATVTRLLFETIVVGTSQFRLLEVTREVFRARASLEAELGRRAGPWELASLLSTSSQARGDYLDDLFNAYGSVPESDGEGSLSASSRFSEQMHRIGARLCADGCRACVQQTSDMMSTAMTEATVSRGLLQRFLDFP